MRRRHSPGLGNTPPQAPRSNGREAVVGRNCRRSCHRNIGGRRQAPRHRRRKRSEPRGTELLHARLRFAHDIVGIRARSRCTHRPARSRPHRRQHTVSQQRQLRLRPCRHREHRSAARRSGRAQRPQHHGRTNQHPHPLATPCKRPPRKARIWLGKHRRRSGIVLRQAPARPRHEPRGTIPPHRRLLHTGTTAAGSTTRTPARCAGKRHGSPHPVYR